MAIQYHEGFPDQNRAAVTGLLESIRVQYYPKATFKVAAESEDTQAVDLHVSGDRVGIKELTDLVADRELELQEQDVPTYYVTTIRTPRTLRNYFAGPVPWCRQPITATLNSPRSLGRLRSGLQGLNDAAVFTDLRKHDVWQRLRKDVVQRDKGAGRFGCWFINLGGFGAAIVAACYGGIAANIHGWPVGIAIAGPLVTLSVLLVSSRWNKSSSKLLVASIAVPLVGLGFVNFIAWIIGRLPKPGANQSWYDILGYGFLSVIDVMLLSLAIYLTIAIMLRAVLILYWRYKGKHSASRELVYCLAKALAASLDQDTWTDERNDTVSWLEGAAWSARWLFRNPPYGDRATRAWLHEQRTMISNNLRYLKRWVLTPLADSRVRYAERVAGMLRAALCGNYDGLRLEEVGLPVEPPIRERLKTTARIAFAGLAPLLVVLVLRATNAISGTPATSLLTVTSVLAALTILYLVDPTAIDRLPPAADLRGLFQPGTRDH